MDERLTFNKSPKGKSGTDISGNTFTTEYLSELIGPAQYDKYNRMRRSDPQVRKVLTAISSPIKAANWFIDPVSSETKDIEVAALIDQILFKDIHFDKKLSEILTFLPHGHSIFEVIHENKESKEFGKYTGLANLAFRNQTSITEWEMDERTGKLLRIHQDHSGDVLSNVWLDVQNLLIFFNEQEGDDNGFPLLRPLYGPWKRKLLIETLKMIGIERSAIPTPTLQVPSNIKPTDEEYKDALVMLSGFTSADNSYITYPEGWELNLHQNQGFDPMKLEDAIKREDEKMAGAILATFLELGTGGNGGAYALGENLERFFSQVISAFAKNVADTINNLLIPNLIKLNFGDTVEVMPKLEFSGITDKVGEEFMRSITGFTNAGVVTADEPLEDYVRKLYNLPKKEEGTILENQETEENNDDETASSDDTGIDDSSDADNATDRSDDTEVEDEKPAEEVQLSEVIQFAEGTRSLITNESTIIKEAMRSNLQFIGEKLVADIVRKYKRLPETGKLRAVEGIKLGGKAKFKRQLKGTLTTTANKSLDQVRKEVPTKSDVKLKENSEFTDILNEKYGSIKFVENDFSNLPAHVRKLITIQSTRIADKQAQDLEDRVVFAFMQSEQTTDSASKIEEEITNAAREYTDGPSVGLGAANVSTTVVNQTRNEFFFNPEVLEEVHAFRFINVDPKTPICQRLAGRVFATNDNEFLSYAPPLHHNCKSFLGVVLTKAKTKPEIEPLPPITKDQRKSVTLSDYVEVLLEDIL